MALCLCLGVSSWAGSKAEVKNDTTATVKKADKTAVVVPDFEMDKTRKRKTIDYSIPLKPISNTDMLLSHFANRNLVFFFFSAKCTHCQNAFPYIQKLANKMEPLGVQTVAIAIKNNSDSDIRDFIREFKCTLPVFQDEKRLFSKPYGTGRIPLTIAVNSSGQYIRFTSFKNEKTTEAIFNLFASGRIDK